MEIIFVFDDYKTYIKERVREEKRTKGSQRALCDAIGVQPSFLSRVLNSSVHLTPEHAEGLTRFWGLNPLETQFFMELVYLGRAGTRSLKSLIQRRLLEIKKQASEVTDRLRLPALKEEVMAFYYSSWLVSAVHVLVSIDGYQTVKAISVRLGVSEDITLGILRQLKNYRLISEEKDKWRVGTSYLHLPKNAPYQALHQANWKQQAIADLYRKSPALHYSSVHSVSNSDFVWIQETLLKTVSQTTEKIKSSPAEKLACFNIDYFEP